MALKDKALLVFYSASQPKLSAVDKGASAEVVNLKGAEARAARVVKTLWDERAYAPIKSLLNSIRAWHYHNTLPWLDNGLRILPSASYLAYAEQLRAYRSQLEGLVDDFVRDYSDRLLRERQRLGDLFSSGDYPSPEALRAQFKIECAVYPVPDSGDFRVDNIGDQLEAELLKAEADRRALDALQSTTRECYDRLHHVVNHLARELRNPDKVKFHDSLIGNIRALLEVLPALNIAEDPGLRVLIDEVDNKLAGLDVDDLKKDQALRVNIACEADAIATRLASYF